ncbi:MAG TPA: hypothetical protein VNO52_17945, partial [Methylomirabilota bacterium]|nr:hypothetical protein [Methylomirabilota bacterium]
PVTAVALERIRSAVTARLHLPNDWRDTIYVSLHPTPQHNAPIVVTSVQHPDQWSYRMHVPEHLEAARFVQAAVQVILMEIANRRARQHAADLPPWLGPGLAATLIASEPAPFIPEPRSSLVDRRRHADPLREIRALLRQQPPLRLDDLCFPPPEAEMTPAEKALFIGCAQLFVHSLLELRDGPARLGRLVTHAADNWNWQTTFLREFQPYFPRLVEADKWWTLQTVLASGRDAFSLWPENDACRRLEELLETPVQIRTRAEDLPLDTRVKLQAVIAEWDPARQVPLLQQKIQLLDSIRPRLSGRAVPLAEAYRKTLYTYLDKRPAGTAPSPPALVRATLRQLDELDARCQGSPATAPANGDRSPPR